MINVQEHDRDVLKALMNIRIVYLPDVSSLLQLIYLDDHYEIAASLMNLLHKCFNIHVYFVLQTALQ